MTNYLARLASARVAWCAAPGLRAPRPSSRRASRPCPAAWSRSDYRAQPTSAGGDVSATGRSLVVRNQDGWLAILGLGLSIEPGEYHVDRAHAGGSAQQLAFTVHDKKYARRSNSRSRPAR